MPLSRTDMTNPLLPAVRGIFHEAYTTRVNTLLWPQIATVVPSTSDKENYGWFGSVPGMRQWVAGRLHKPLSTDDYTLTNLTYESTLDIERTAIEDDKLGGIKMRVQSYADEAARDTEYRVFDQLRQGATLTAFDGTAFFANRGTNQNNTGTDALTEANLSSAIAKMMSFVDEEGKPYGVMPNLLVVPPSLWTLGLKLTNSGITVVNVGDGTAGSGATAATSHQNVIAGMGIRCITSPYLTDTTDWFLLDTTRACKPIIFQSRTPVELTAMEQDSQNGYEFDRYSYGIRERKAIGYGPWWVAYGSIVTGS